MTENSNFSTTRIGHDRQTADDEGFTLLLFFICVYKINVFFGVHCPKVAITLKFPAPQLSKVFAIENKLCSCIQRKRKTLTDKLCSDIKMQAEYFSEYLWLAFGSAEATKNLKRMCE